MARPREFDESEVLEKAMLVFWQKGYEGASIYDLMTATGLTKSSIYKAFNSKEGLFWKANERYKKDHLGFIEEALVLSKPRDIAEAMLRGEADMHTNPEHPPGCFETNGALACSEESVDVQRALVDSRFGFQKRLAKAFRNTSENGPMLPNASPEEAASFVFTLIQGMAVQAKAGLSRAELQKFVTLTMMAWPE
ncbi:AcrR family transcriptional regulator [Rhizobium leguminosarum]|uniref:AcrR family transcriptional regulator n=1 Tax=Rhizobium leguminosarum TaxID=384 RepID=A0AAE2SX70_RHILE|nr:MULTISPECIES: TetR/AcrR family transcriptional regulator [Rhizobium]MBB4291476.1 AcrR family transcriptional regulator [Rhizobium leguminosarum]MBB4296173.1 AcrR family transcriptional regulator [Rhizobium leguminosarum]MBB4308568.1 AcrR family transcriptional regulator [Rhizobium leguminosarum]MBB4416403.1 AcrR family transcriptional regulator [Rhizobium leguminosarum]MBB4430630.1 AcrR family transcriptional regulator [Rhizobium esperanzae]